MARSFASQYQWAQNIDDYEQLSTKPGPLSEEETHTLKRARWHLICGIEAEMFCWPEEKQPEVWADYWRRWFGEEPPTHADGMAECKRLIAETTASITKEAAHEFFAAVRKRETNP